MGGEAAKERRRLKRLAAAQGKSTDVAEAATPVSALKTESKEAKDIVQLRLQRKIARKANGKFKPLEGQVPPQGRKRKQESNSKKISPTKKFKGHQASSKKFNRKNTMAGKTSSTRKTTSPKKIKPKKPKHLKRKMEQLTKAMSSGEYEGKESTVAQLEEQMQVLAKQMEELKKIKSKSAPTSQATKETKPVLVESKEASEVSISEHSSADSEEVEISPSCPATNEDSSSDDEDDLLKQTNIRSRGKRRRGRRENNLAVSHEDEVKVEDIKDDRKNLLDEKELGDVSGKEDVKASASAPRATEADTNQSKKTSKKDDKRRCIGRKPVTDFEIGKVYNGKIQYIKPHLGAFIDIGSHSDAFLHISCISDSYISNVHDVFNVGDEVENARVVEIDREKKRITLSLRSVDVGVNCQKAKCSSADVTEPIKKKEEKSSLHNKPKENANVPSNDTLTVSSANETISDNQGRRKPPHEKTGADLKRERKLARRAARRAALQNE